MVHGNSILTSEDKYNLISKNSAEGIIIIDETGTIDEWNGFMESRTKYSKSEISGRKIWDVQFDLLTKDYKDRYPVEALHKIWMNFINGLKDNEVITKEGQFISKNKDIVLTEDIICQIKLYGKSYLYVIQRDRPKQDTDPKDVLISIISHELRSLISSLIDFSKIFNSDKIRIDKISKLVKQAISISEHSSKLLDNYSLWQKNLTGNLAFKPKRIILNSFIKEVFKEHSQLAAKKNIVTSFLPERNIICYADEYMLKTILSNLIHNSLKFTDSGGIINVDAVSLQDKIKIIVSDNGTGINDSARKKLFHITYENNGEEGYGFGLVLCKDFVEKHGGKIWYDSIEEKGSTFYFTLPNKLSAVF